MKNFTVTHATRTTRPRRSGASPVSTDVTTVRDEDGEVVATIIWNGALLRRLEREHMTRAEYIAKVAGINA